MVTRLSRTNNSKLGYLGRREFNSTLHQSSYGFATRVHGFATKTKALAREIPPATQATGSPASHSLRSRIHARTPTRSATGFTLRSPNFFPPSLGACLQATPHFWRETKTKMRSTCGKSTRLAAPEAPTEDIVNTTAVYFVTNA